MGILLQSELWGKNCENMQAGLKCGVSEICFMMEVHNENTILNNRMRAGINDSLHFYLC
jgi:hypothetical protein